MLLLAVAALAGASLAYLVLRYAERDATTMLTIWLVLLWGISAQWVVAPLGAVGTPAVIFGLGLMGLWLAARLSGRGDPLARGVQPVRLGLGVFVAVNALSYAVAHTRTLTALEVTSSDRRLIMLASLVGVALLAADGIRSRDRLDALLRRVVIAAAVVAGIAALHFFTGFDLVPKLRVPGLSSRGALVHGIGGGRSLFTQPQATAGHPIELGVILAMVLPLALHFAYYAPERWARGRFWAAVCIIAVGIPLTVSRSGVLALAVAMVVMALGWSWRWRLNLAVYAVGFTGAMWAVVPGLIGTLRSFFQEVGPGSNDPSVVARRERVPRVIEQLGENGPLGLGPGTFTPEDYFLLDNQYYGTLLELGWLGVFAQLLMIGVGIALALVAKRRQDPETQHLGQALAAGLAVVPVAMVTFDAFGFHILSGMTFLLIGAAGALWRLTAPERAAARRLPPPAETSERADEPSPSGAG